MLADDFVEWLHGLPGFIQKLALDSPEEHPYVAEMLEKCLVKLESPATAPLADPVLDLVRRYDVGSLELVEVEFYSEIVGADDGWYFAEYEVDKMRSERMSGEIHLKYGQRMSWRVARHGGAFLDALAAAQNFALRTVYDTDLYSDEGANAQQADLCARVAGGSDYLRFYRMMFSCEPL